MKIKKGDTIIVRTGRDNGKTGEVIHSYPKKNKVVVENINIHTKFIKKGPNQPGQQVKIERPIGISKIQLICPSCKKQTRVGYNFTKEGTKYRVCKKCNESIEKAFTKTDKIKK